VLRLNVTGLVRDDLVEMASGSSANATRLVLCVDGTTKTSGNQTNISRIYSGVKRGKCLDNLSGLTFNQIPRYISGIGSADDAFSKDRIQASVFGQGYLKQIQDVYESCCQLTGPRDEVWLFGFSRGAFVVRAVAGLLHIFGSIASAGQPDFDENFKKLLKEADRRQGGSGLTLSPVSSISTSIYRPAPKIRFVGAFDTIKAGNDISLFDIYFNTSIQHMRHALALHEDRKALTPEYMYPDELYRKNLRESKRSFIQAWFIGNHADLGGSAKKAGLGLYPLQWMVVEAMKCGLAVDFGETNSGSLISNPLSVVCPNAESSDGAGQWSCTTANGIDVTMYDIREVHEQLHFKDQYAVKLGSRFVSIRMKKQRETFQVAGGLKGYYDQYPQGTIIHPSVYLLLDEHTNISLEMRELKLQRNLEEWRAKMLGSQDGVINTGFWLDRDDDDAVFDPGAIRVLVCGNTGVGKSTLINKTFGVEAVGVNSCQVMIDVLTSGCRRKAQTEPEAYTTCARR
jgi:hypothetical protein